LRRGERQSKDDEELRGGVTDWLLAVAEALDRHGHERVDVDLEVVVSGECKEPSLNGVEVVVPREVHAGVDKEATSAGVSPRHTVSRRPVPCGGAPPRSAGPSCPWHAPPPAQRPAMEMALGQQILEEEEETLAVKGTTLLERQELENQPARPVVPGKPNQGNTAWR
jgi:hypothetical protein